MDAYTVDQLEAKRELVKRVRFYIRIRWYFLSAIAVAGLGANIALYGYDSTFYRGLLLTSFALGVNAVFWLASRKDRSLSYFQTLAVIQLLLDIVLFSVAVFIGGGPVSGGVSLYSLVLIITAALFESRIVYLMAALCLLGLVVASGFSSGKFLKPTDAGLISFQAVVLFIKAYLIDTFFGLSRHREAERAQMSIISLTSHQLRTPATAVKGLLSMLMEDTKNLSVDDREIFMRAFNENERQLQLIGNLLEVARIDMENIKPTPTQLDLSEMAKQTVENMQPIAIKNGQKLTFDNSATMANVMVDADQIHMILDNLLTNALNYSGRGSHIVVRLAQQPNLVLMSVEDNGQGIARADQARLFERFTKLHYSHPQTTEGAGLGLYIVKKLVELNNGRIDLVSYPNEGTVFTVSLPDHAHS